MRIQPYSENPFYWQYKGEPVLLLGGTIEDNVYQIPDIEAHLNLLAPSGGNYVRCTMSCRDEGNVWWFGKGTDGLYDLDQPGEEHWDRFARFLELAEARDIIAQIEVWDRFDFARENWQSNPYNPTNNVNYSVDESGLADRYELHPGRKENGFFRTVPALENNEVVLAYQQQQVDRMLAISLPHTNVLYCVDNETNESPEWGRYWSEYIHAKAAEADVLVCTTEMWDAHSLLADQHKYTLDHPDTYAFVDVSQNNHQVGFEHWQNPQAVRDYVIESGRIRPLNSVKIYGANTGSYGTNRDAQERFWRNILGGLATSRFHRPPSGIGLSTIAVDHLRSARAVTDLIPMWTCEPHLELLSVRSRNEAYCAADPGSSYIVFFPDGGDVMLDVSHAEGDLSLKWMDIRDGNWVEPSAILDVAEGTARLVTPREDGYWVAVVHTV
jgi:hypothetical protein